jgi:hypothetical protein
MYMSQGTLPRAERESIKEPPVSGDPYNQRPNDEQTIRRRTLDDMRKLSEEIKSVRARKDSKAIHR